MEDLKSKTLTEYAAEILNEERKKEELRRQEERKEIAAANLKVCDLFNEQYPNLIEMIRNEHGFTWEIISKSTTHHTFFLFNNSEIEEGIPYSGDVYSGSVNRMTGKIYDDNGSYPEKVVLRAIISALDNRGLI